MLWLLCSQKSHKKQLAVVTLPHTHTHTHKFGPLCSANQVQQVSVIGDLHFFSFNGRTRYSVAFSSQPEISYCLPKILFCIWLCFKGRSCSFNPENRQPRFLFLYLLCHQCFKTISCSPDKTFMSLYTKSDLLILSYKGRYREREGRWRLFAFWA